MTEDTEGVGEEPQVSASEAVDSLSEGALRPLSDRARAIAQSAVAGIDPSAVVDLRRYGIGADSTRRALESARAQIKQSERALLEDVARTAADFQFDRLGVPPRGLSPEVFRLIADFAATGELAAVHRISFAGFPHLTDAVGWRRSILAPEVQGGPLGGYLQNLTEQLRASEAAPRMAPRLFRLS